MWRQYTRNRGLKNEKKKERNVKIRVCDQKYRMGWCALSMPVNQMEGGEEGGRARWEKKRGMIKRNDKYRQERNSSIMFLSKYTNLGLRKCVPGREREREQQYSIGCLQWQHRDPIAVHAPS